MATPTRCAGLVGILTIIAACSTQPTPNVPVPRSGIIQVFQSQPSMQVPNGALNVRVRFEREGLRRDWLLRPACAVIADGPCLAYRCPSLNAETNEPHAGTVRLEPPGFMPIALDPLSTGAYPVRGFDGAPYRAGDEVTVSAGGAGSGLPAFTVAAQIPSALAVTTPTPDASGHIAIERGTPLEVAWTGDATATVYVQLRQDSTESTDGLIVSCRFEASAGRAAIPVEVLAELAPNPGGSPGATLTIGALRELQVQVAETVVRLEVYSYEGTWRGGPVVDVR